MTKVAINGFGRIGRLVARAILERTDHDLELVAINDLADAKSNAMLFKRDSVHGPFPGTVEADGNDIIVNGKRIHVTAERDPANLPHAANGIDTTSTPIPWPSSWAAVATAISTSDPVAMMITLRALPAALMR